MRMEGDNIVSDTSPENIKYPQSLIRNSRVANTVRAMQVRDLFHIDTTVQHMAEPDDVSLARTMYDRFKSIRASYCPGDEYELVLLYAKHLDWDKMIYIRDE